MSGDWTMFVKIFQLELCTYGLKSALISVKSSLVRKIESVCCRKAHLKFLLPSRVIQVFMFQIF